MDRHNFNRHCLTLVLLTFALYVALEVAGIAIAYWVYAAVFALGWIALAFKTVWRKAR